ncbi:MAG: S1C family serine protease [Gemmatimonadaceae bacterium]
MSPGKAVKTVAALALVAGVGVGASIAARRAGPLPGAGAPQLIGLPIAAQQAARDDGEATVIRVARQATPAVVAVSVRGGSGSGVIVRRDGVVITNAHVVGNAADVEIGLADGRRVAGRVLGRDPSVDIVVVRIPAADLPVAPLADSDQLQVGQTAIAIGNPIGLERTVTTGVVSAVNRSPRGFELGGLIQTDAAINPGNSGGPLLDSQGRVMGINTVIVRGTTGLGFAIPINLARDIAEQVLTTGRIRRTYLGIVPDDLIPELAQQYNLPVREGIIVRHVEPGSPAARAGLQLADIITRIEGQPVATSGDLRRILRSRRPGDTVRLTVVRVAGRDRATTLTLTARLGEATEG